MFDKRYSFLHPSEVRLWTRVTGLTVDAMPVKEGDSPAIRNFGEKVGNLVLEESDDPGQLEAVTYWDCERG